MRIQLFVALYADVAQIAPITVEPTTDAAFVAGDLCRDAECAFSLLRQIAPVHTSFDYRLGETPVLCDWPGYGTELSVFDSALALEVGR